MTKIGEGKNPIPEPTAASYQADLEKSSQKFLKALNQYHRSQSSAEQERLRGIMDQQMGLIQAALDELKKKGLHKEGSLVAKDYADYKDEETTENFICLRNDLETLREHNSN